MEFLGAGSNRNFSINAAVKRKYGIFAKGSPKNIRFPAINFNAFQILIVQVSRNFIVIYIV